MSTHYNPVRGFFIGKMRRITTFLILMPFFSPFNMINVPGLALNIKPINGIKEPVIDILENPINETTTMEVLLTAYASVPEQTDEDPFITASGRFVRDGIIAANFLPFGTKVKIPELFGDKIFTVEDRMHRRFSERVDIWMPSANEAVKFGIRQAEIVILDKNGNNLVMAK